MKYILASLLVLVITVVQAGTGPLFRLNTQETANGLATQINTTIPNRTYPRAGLVLPANYTLSSSSCAWMFNNVCMLSLDNSNPQSVYLIGKAGDAPSTLCLNGVGQLNCQQFDMQAVPKMIVAGIAHASCSCVCVVCVVGWIEVGQVVAAFYCFSVLLRDLVRLMAYDQLGQLELKLLIGAWRPLGEVRDLVSQRVLNLVQGQAQ